MIDGRDSVVNFFKSAKGHSIVFWIAPSKEPWMRMECDPFDYTDSLT